MTLEEKESGQMRADHLQAAVRALEEDGIVVLKNVADRSHLETLRERMLADLEAILAREDAPYNFTTSNVQQDPPPLLPYLFKDVLFNEMAIAVTHALLGDGVKNSYYSGNTALPSEKRQPVHPDVGQLWQGLEHPTPAFGVVVNVPVVTMTPENGSTEVWPGSHKDTSFSIYQGSIRIPEETLEARRKVAPPVQPVVEQGDLLIRDIRLWHAGMPNRTQEPRPMIAMIHWKSWWNDGEPIRMPKGTEEFFQHPVLKTNVRFLDEVDYLMHNHAYDFKK